MADKEKVCKECGCINEGKAKECVSCGAKQFLDKYKGKVVVLDYEKSDIADKLKIGNNGKFALKYGA